MKGSRVARGFRAALCLAVFALVGRAALAQLSPGELSRPHAALDTSDRCLDCHSPQRGVDASRCLTCHQALGRRIAQGEGLHSGGDYRACERCHIEHQGSSFELVYWGEGGESAFDHSDTGWPLAGAHARLGCRDCHRRDRLREASVLEAGGADPSRTLLGLEAACASCHQDPHRAQFGAESCSVCHSAATWRPAVGFDHSRTDFALSGGHEGLACAKCHTPEGGAEAGGFVRFRGVPTGCASCHADPHAGRLGARCESCHATGSWKRIDRGSFDHDSTAYPLRGRHAGVECASCHRRGQGLRIAGFDRCATCHVDAHAGQITARTGGEDCSRCHSVEGFRPALFTVEDHDRTTYPLQGAHRAVGCVKCHTRAAPAEIERSGVRLVFSGARPATLVRIRFGQTSCRSCHRDPHGGQVDAFLTATGCASCHTVKGWSEVGFDHARTDFALLGVHRSLACRRCHMAAGSVTEARSGRDPGRAVRFGGVPRECAGCHADPHLGQFLRGSPRRACEACHGNENWSPTGFDHRRDTAFALEGAHRAVACVSCHPSALVGDRSVARFRGVSRRCVACHSSKVVRR